jgi:hypothetical protein
MQGQKRKKNKAQKETIMSLGHWVSSPGASKRSHDWRLFANHILY